uniref:Uncharacterized protein n=1 Tax=Globisporangium ultimum (strain ATCC 200006 / CBS 805.95 / DAOM BR144) TaxID=431595 RepID=K3XBS0_GLOUD
MVQLTTLLGAAALVATFALTDLASAHPGQQHHVKSAAEIAHRKLFHADAHRSLKACANSPHARKLQERTVARRAAKVQQLRQEHAVRRRSRPRTTHIHVLGSHGGTVLENNTYSGAKSSHTGQLFFDQDLLTEVAATATYAVNTQTVTLNSADSILSESAATGFDPMLEYALLGDSVEDGIFAWISIGVDMTRAEAISGAATWTADGGVMSESNGVGGGPSGSMGGAPPSGSGFGGGSMGAPPSGGSVGGAPPSSTVTTASSSSSSSAVTSDASTTATTTTTACIQTRRA